MTPPRRWCDVTSSHSNSLSVFISTNLSHVFLVLNESLAVFYLKKEMSIEKLKWQRVVTLLHHRNGWKPDNISPTTYGTLGNRETTIRKWKQKNRIKRTLSARGKDVWRSDVRFLSDDDKRFPFKELLLKCNQLDYRLYKANSQQSYRFTFWDGNPVTGCRRWQSVHLQCQRLLSSSRCCAYIEAARFNSRTVSHRRSIAWKPSSDRQRPTETLFQQ